MLIAHTEIPSRARPPWLSGHRYLRQACLDHPDWIRRSAGHDARYGGGAGRAFLFVVELLSKGLLAIAISERGYRARWDDADEGGHGILK